jgi:hypothetical protein
MERVKLSSTYDRLEVVGEQICYNIMIYLFNLLGQTEVCHGLWLA